MSKLFPIIEEKGKLFSFDFVFIWIVTFLLFATYYALISILPIYLANLGGSESHIGLIIGIYFISNMVSMPLVGNFLELKGNKFCKPMMYLATLLFVFCSVSYGLTKNFHSLVVLRIIHGAVEAVFFVPANVFVFSIIPPRRRGEGISYYLISVNLGLVVGSPVGVFIMKTFGFTTLFWSIGCVAFASFLIVRWLQEASLLTEAQNAPKAKAHLINRRALLPSFVILTACISYGAIITFLPLLATNLGINNYGLVFSTYAAVVIASRLLFGRLSDRDGRQAYIIGANSLIVLAMWLLAFSSSFHMLLAFAIIFGLGFGQMPPLLQAFMLGWINPGEKGSAMATFWLSFNLGIFVGSLLLGMVLQASGFAITFIISGIITLSGLLVFVLREKRYRR